jgi:hypothetical protein
LALNRILEKKKELLAKLAESPVKSNRRFRGYPTTAAN